MRLISVFVLSRDSDLVMLGDCDKSVTSVCDKLGWKEELDNVQVTSLEDSLKTS